jgi:glyoxylase-like metal-dependent hydrolase (beta-lactamase superfamily II)
VDAKIERVLSPDVNAWLIGDDEEVIVIDPGSDATAVLSAIGEREILAVICTHGHREHIAAATEVADRDEAPIALHSLDKVAWRETHQDGDPDIAMADGGVFEVADVKLEVIHTPGHSPGSVCLYCDELGVVFSGDTLLASGPVPHDGEYPDLPGQLTAIGEQLLTMPGATRVLSGHGEETTIALAERQFDSWAAARG